ncbi:hypothetical protein D3C87_1442710 [compost metagenome]
MRAQASRSSSIAAAIRPSSSSVKATSRAFSRYFFMPATGLSLRSSFSLAKLNMTDNKARTRLAVVRFAPMAATTALMSRRETSETLSLPRRGWAWDFQLRVYSSTVLGRFLIFSLSAS